MSTALWNDEQDKPLQHLRIVDLTEMYAGPYLTRILAQYGAEVIKLENLSTGDPARPSEAAGFSEWLNQGKRSVGINLKAEAGVDLVRQIVAEADVFVENFRDGAMEDLGLGYPALSEINPELLYVSLRGFRGKNTPKSGQDLNFVATSGCGEWLLEQGPNYATHWADLVGGTLAPAIKILAHLSNPDRRGMQLVSYIDESFRSIFVHRAFDGARAEAGSQPHSRYYRCQDGQWISLNAIVEKHWDGFCEVVAQPAWRGRANDPHLSSEVASLFEQHPSAYWEALMAGHDFCLFRVVTWQEALGEAGVRDQIARDPLRWAGFAANADLAAAPKVGADTWSVLQEMGLSESEFEKYQRDGIIGQS